MITRQADFVVCGEAEEASKAFTVIEWLKPDLVIADIPLQDSSGLELMRNIKAEHPAWPALGVGVHDESKHAGITLRAGVPGDVMEQDALAEAPTTVRRVLCGNILVNGPLVASPQEIQAGLNEGESNHEPQACER